MFWLGYMRGGGMRNEVRGSFRSCLWLKIRLEFASLHDLRLASVILDVDDVLELRD